MATRTAGTVDGSGVRKDVSFGFIDESGDVRTVTFQLRDDVTNAQIEALAVALQAASNASLWRIGVEEVYEGVMSDDNATNATHPSVFDNVSIGYRQLTTGLSKTAYIPAPVDGITLDGDAVDTDNDLYEAVRGAALTALGTGWATRFTRFTERREINRRSPA